MPPNPFLITLFVAWKSLPLLLGNLPLTYLEIPPLCRGANSHPLCSLVSCKLTPPPFFPIPLSPSQRFPFSNACPPTTTLRYRLHIVRYTYKILAKWMAGATCWSPAIGQTLPGTSSWESWTNGRDTSPPIGRN